MSLLGIYSLIANSEPDGVRWETMEQVDAVSVCRSTPEPRSIGLKAMSRRSVREVNSLPQSSRSRIVGLTESARCAGIHVAKSPSNDIATTTPASTNGSRGVA